MKNGCCRDDFFYQKSDTHKILDSGTISQQDPVMEIVHYNNIQFSLVENTAELITYLTSPEPASVKDLVILHRVFRI